MTFDRIMAIASLVTTILGGGGLLIAILQIKKTRAESKFIQSQADVNYNQIAEGWIGRLQKRITELEGEVAHLRQVIEDQRSEIRSLIRRLTSNASPEGDQ